MPVLTGAPPPGSVNPKPPVVRDARFTAVLMLIFCIFGALVSTGILVASIMGSSGFPDPQRRARETAQAFLLTLGCFGFAALYIWLLVGLKRRYLAAWRVQAALAVLALLAFPLGTILHALILTRWFKPETKAWFGLT